MDFEKDWRPNSAHGVPLSDLDLAKIGLLGQLYVQCVFHVATALKGLEQRDFNQWKQDQDREFSQLAGRLLTSARKLGDEIMLDCAEQIDREHRDTFKHRHQGMHSLFSHDGSSPIAQAYDVRRNEWITSEQLDGALERMAKFTQVTCRAGNRVAELIIDGTLKERSSAKGPSIRIHDKLVKI